MKSSVVHPRLFVIVILLALTISSVMAQDQTVNGNLGVSGILDVNGDTLNLGTWSSGSANYGFNVGYAEDASHAATLTLTATRPTANWIWQQAASTGTGSVPKMKLSAGNVLTLYDQASTPNPTIVLDPLGTSTFGTSTTFNGMDNEMPHQTYMGPNSVLTVGLGDSRYQALNTNAYTAIGSGAISDGISSTAMGYDANASGGNSLAVGRNADSGGGWGVAVGPFAYATNEYTTALGHYARATGDTSTAIGNDAMATQQYGVAIGAETQATGLYAMALGTFAVANNANSVAFGYGAQATAAGGLAIGTNTYATNFCAVVLGYYSTASGYMSSTFGTGAVANNYEATALGKDSGASGNASAALGFNSSAAGDYSTALGSFSNASGYYSTAISSSSAASGDYSVSASRGAATSVYQATVGAFALSGGDPHIWVATDDLFTVGNGQSAAAPSNAFSVKKNGNTTVAGDLAVQGTIIVQPQGDLSMGTFTATPSPTP